MSLRTWLAALSVSPRAASRYQSLANPLKLLNGFSPLPLNIDLVLTMRCNFSCHMCNCRKEDNREIVAKFRTPELTPEEWMAVIEDIRKSFFLRPNLTLLGGEPSIYRDYLRVVESIKQAGFRCSYTTNGSFLNRDAREIVSIGTDVIAVSIDGPQEIHDGIRGPGAFENAIEGIRAIESQKRSQAKAAPRVFLTCAIMGDNYDHLAQLVDVAADVDLDYVNFLHLQFPDSELGTHGIDVELLIQEIDKTKSRAADKGIGVNFYPHLRTEQIPVYYLQPSDRLGTGCISPWLRMSIMPDGTIISCGDYVVGNVRDSAANMKKTWNNHRFRAFRKKLSNDGLFAECGRCCRKQY